jgi:hypothetical protein
MRRHWDTATIGDRPTRLGSHAGRLRRRGQGVRPSPTWVPLLAAMSLYWLTPSPAVAQAPPTWQLTFTAPATCSTEENFRKALDERLLYSEIFPRALNHRIIVSISPTEAGWTGQLVVESAVDGVRVERTAHATSCQELVPALALMIALVLDLEPASTPEPPSSPPVPEADSRPFSPPFEGPPRLVPPTPASSKSTPGFRQTASLRAAPRLTEGELGFLLHWRSVVGWRDRVAVAPSILWGSHVAQGFSPWMRLSGERVKSHVVNASGVGASLTWTVAQLDACSHKWTVSGTAFLSPCARISVGALQAKGDAGVAAPRELTRFWLTAGGGAEAAIPIVGPLWLRVQGGVEALLLRQRIYVDSDPDHILVQMPAVLGVLGLGLGVRIW